MVGTGHYSNKCGTCRRRKLKCGEEKPTCIRCQRAGLECEGYARDYKWIDEGRAGSRGRSAGHSSQVTPKVSPEGEDLKQTQKLQIRGGRKETPSVPQASSRSTSSSQSDHMDQYLLMEYRNKPPGARMQRNLSTFSSDVCICFTVKRLFDGGPGILGCDYQTWLADIQNTEPTSVSYIALQCLAAAFFARMHGNQPTIMEQAAALYGQALRQLSVRINDTRTCFDHENVSATMTLHLYETVMYTNRAGWIEHAGGTGRLIEMRGPERHQNFPDHAYFLLCRFRIILRSLISRKRTFLEADEWKIVPWAKYPETKTPMHYLQDILCDFPGLCEDRLDMDTAAARGEDTTIQRGALAAKLISDFRDLVRWRWQWDASNPNVAYEKAIDVSNSLSVDSAGPLFDNILHFKSLEHATELVLYNSTLQMMSHFYRDVTKKNIFAPAMAIWPPNERPEPTNPLKLPSETLDREEIVSEICRSVEYHLHGSHASSGAFSLMFPLRVCSATLCMLSKTRKILWMIRLCKTIADSTGFELLRHVFSLKNLVSGQRISETKKYMPPEVVALVESKEIEML